QRGGWNQIQPFIWRMYDIICKIILPADTLVQIPAALGEPQHSVLVKKRKGKIQLHIPIDEKDLPSKLRQSISHVRTSCGLPAASFIICKTGYLCACSHALSVSFPHTLLLFIHSVCAGPGPKFLLISRQYSSY